MIVDAVGGGASQPDIYGALSANGMREVGEVVTGKEGKVPEGAKKTMALGRQMFEVEGGEGAMAALATLLMEGRYELPSKVEMVGEGFETIAGGLERLKGGVSGRKLVVTI